MRSEQFGLELVEPFGAARAQREIATARGELAGHAAAKAGAGAGDEDGFAHIDHSCVTDECLVFPGARSCRVPPQAVDRGPSGATRCSVGAPRYPALRSRAPEAHAAAR